MLLRHARCVFVYAATDTAFYCARTFLGLAESRILPAAPVGTRPRTPLISFCTVQLRTLCAAHSLATFCLFTTSGPDLGELPGFWGSIVFRHALIPRKGSGNNNKQQQEQQRATTRTLTATSLDIVITFLPCILPASFINVRSNVQAYAFLIENAVKKRKDAFDRWHTGYDKPKLVLKCFYDCRISLNQTNNSPHTLEQI